ncbi:MAG: 4Fe-4S dicluster domain-containing protein [Syntrophomonas sp.]
MARMCNMYDTSKCTACRGCQVACKNWNQLPAVIEPFTGNYQTHKDTNGDTYTIVKFIEHEDPVKGVKWNFIKRQCLHCFDPACKQACPQQAISINEWGAVVKDYDKCIGCQYCSYACPFEIPKYRKREDTVTKCTLCADRVDAGEEPACAKTCVAGALSFGNREELLVQARERVKYLRANGFPRATIYGELELGGTNNLYILTDTPDKFDLPVNPKIPGQISFWQNYVQPYVGWLMPLMLGASAFSFVTTRILANKNGHEEGGHE